VDLPEPPFSLPSTTTCARFSIPIVAILPPAAPARTHVSESRRQ
jgi:hypothetical protein